MYRPDRMQTPFRRLLAVFLCARNGAGRPKDHNMNVWHWVKKKTRKKNKYNHMSPPPTSTKVSLPPRKTRPDQSLNMPRIMLVQVEWCVKRKTSANRKGRPTKVAPGTFVGCHCQLRSTCTRGTPRAGIVVATLQKYLHEHTPTYLAISKYSHWSSIEALLTTNAVLPQYRPSESHSTMSLTVSISAKIPMRRKTSGLR